MTNGDLTGDVEKLTGVTSGGSATGEMTREEKREQRDRVKRFLALPPQLQEGILKYGERIRQAYAKGGLTKTK